MQPLDNAGEDAPNDCEVLEVEAGTALAEKVTIARRSTYFAPIDWPTGHKFKLTVSSTGEEVQFEAGYNGQTSYDSARYFRSTLWHRLIGRLPESKRVNGFTEPGFQAGISAPLTDITIEAIATGVPQSELKFHDYDSEIMYRAKCAELKIFERNARISAEWKIGQKVPAHNYEIHPDPSLALAPYQQVALCLCMANSGFSLFMEQGTGKTPVVVATICNMAARLQEDRPLRVLIVGPNNIRANWESEICKFTTRTGKITVLRGDNLDRVSTLVEAMRKEPEVEFSAVVCGYGILQNSWEYFEIIPWDLIVYDESHAFKSPSTTRFKMVEKFREISSKVITLTGTPIANHAIDTFAQFEAQRKHGSGFSSFTKFKKFYGKFETMAGSQHEMLVGVQNLPFLKDRFARHSFSITKKEALPNLPDKLYSLLECEMSKQQKEAYDRIATELMISIDKTLADDSRPRSMVINCILTQLLRLEQITSGFISWDKQFDFEGTLLNPERIEYFHPNPKMDVLFDHLLTWDDPNSKALVWACFHPDIDWISHALTTWGIQHVTFTGKTSEKERARAEYEFNNNPECRIFVGNGAAGGCGLNLIGYPPHSEQTQTYCDRVYYYSQNWSRIIRSQSEDRAHRRGTLHPVNIFDVCVPHSIDEQIRMRVLDKIQHALEVGDITQLLRNSLNA